MGHGTDPEPCALHPAHVTSGSSDQRTSREVPVRTSSSSRIMLHTGADIGLIRPDEINRACGRVMDEDLCYCFVIDMALLKA